MPPLTKSYLSDTGGATGLTLFHRVRLFPSGLVLDNTDGVFRAAVTFANSKVPALEVTVANGFPADMLGWYQTDETRTVHADGIQTFELVNAAGAQYAGGGVLELEADASITGKMIKDQTDLIVSGGAIENGGRLEDIDTVTSTLPSFPSDPASESSVESAITTSEGVITTAITALGVAIKDRLSSMWSNLLGRK